MDWIGLGLLFLVAVFGLGALFGAGIRVFRKPVQAGALLHRQLAALSADQATLRQQYRDVHTRVTALESQILAAGLRPATVAGAQQMPVQPAAPPAPDRTPAPAVPAALATESNFSLPPAGKPARPADVSPATPARAVAPAVAPADAPADAPAVTAAMTPTTTPPPRPAPRAPATAAPPAAPDWLQTTLQRWVFGGNPLVKIGVLILFLGLAFLLRYAAAHAVLPVEYRYAGVGASAIGLLLMGWRWRRRADKYGLILQGAGVAVMYLTTLAAMKLHPLIEPAAGLVLLIAVAGLAALLAIVQDALVLAIIGTLGGFAAPVLASTGGGNHVMLFSYLALLNLGIVSIAWFKAWRSLNLIGFTCSFGLGAAWAARSYQPPLFASTEPFLLLLFGLYVLITCLFARRTLAGAADLSAQPYREQVRQAAGQVSYVDGTLVFGVPVLSFGMQYLLARDWAYGPAFSALGFGLTYLLLAAALLRHGGRRYLLLNETLVALGVVFASLAIPLALEPEWTAAVWALEAAGVYWIGLRQQRWHARMFALLLLGGAAVHHLASLGQNVDARPVLDGPVLATLLLAISAGTMGWLMVRVGAAVPPGKIETRAPPVLLGASLLFAALLPFLLLPMTWAAPALAVLALGALIAGLRSRVVALLYWGWWYQAVAGALFATTLRGAGTLGPLGTLAETGVLASRWSGLLAAALIGASLLAGVAALLRQPLALPGKLAAHASGSVLLAGLVFINLAPLFVLPWRYAALIWPVSGVATLYWSLRAGQRTARLFALGLQALAALAHLASRSGPYLFDTQTGVAASPFLHTGFWAPLLLAGAALLAARQLQRAAARDGAPVAGSMARSMARSVANSVADSVANSVANSVARSGPKRGMAAIHWLGWLSLAWAGLWWSFGWAAEIVRVLPSVAVAPAQVGICLASVVLMGLYAGRRAWPQLGKASLVYLPLLALIAAQRVIGPDLHPLSGWGWLAWPLALAVHGWLVRQQRAWLDAALLDLAHVAGAWLTVLLAAVELRFRFAGFGAPDSAWALLGWMIAPVAYLAALTSARLRQRWPLAAHLHAYQVVAAAPLAVYLLAWLGLSNAVSDGSAAPLPYLPLLNPLEMAQLATLLGLGLWWRSLQGMASWRARWPLAALLGGASALALLTGVVLRTCHHWGGVPWQTGALLASELVQTALSVTWGTLAICLMLAGHRQRQRWVWITGAVLIGVVVAKLFLVELAAHGSLARIISFIVVGLLLLLVGYFAPLPPRRSAPATPTHPPQRAA